MKIAVYTRQVEPEAYTSYLANSIHLAISPDGVHYQPLNKNYGILFAKAEINEENMILAKGIKEPIIYKTDNGLYAIKAMRINLEDTNDTNNSEKILCWTSKNLINFSEEESKEIMQEERKMYESLKTAGLPDLSNIEGAIPGNFIEVDKEIADQLMLYYNALQNVSITVPDAVTAVCKEEIDAVNAIAGYSDGSTIIKKVSWNTAHVDFSKPGTYRVEGEIIQNQYKFPLAVGFADPDVIKWGDSYYYIATNDNTDDKGLYVRKATSVTKLFSSDTPMHLILDVDPIRQLLQTFWAPEFHVIGGELYILFAVGGKVWGPQSHMMKLKKDGDILKAEDWENPIRVVKKDGTYLAEGVAITLDMTYLSVDQKDYLLWSYREHTMDPLDTGSMLYIAAIDPKTPWQLTTEPVLLSRPLYGWENINGTINNEGPYPLVTEKNIYITYSGGAAGGYSYVLGLLTAARGEDILNTANWSKSSGPVLTYYSVPGEYGPGHNTFFTDDDGNTMIAYHAQEKMNGTPRCTGIRRVHFDRLLKPRLDMSLNQDLNEDLRKVSMKVLVK